MPEHVKLKFVKPGMLTTVQGGGRFTYREYGVPVGGPMDKYSAQNANWLVGNELSGPLLEITVLGPTINFAGSCQIAITGADISPKLNGAFVPMNETLWVPNNSQLNFGKLNFGCRAYLAIAGEIIMDDWLESKNTAPVHGVSTGIKKDDEIVVNVELNREARKLIDANVFFSELNEIRVLSGPEFNEFDSFFIGSFFSRNHRITADSNRMGYRLEKVLSFEQDRELISSPVIPGTIQITPVGQPIVLMVDAQTTGGYFRFLNVVSDDLNKLAQLKPGDEVRFKLVDSFQNKNPKRFE